MQDGDTVMLANAGIHVRAETLGTLSVFVRVKNDLGHRVRDWLGFREVRLSPRVWMPAFASMTDDSRWYAWTA